MSFAIQDWAEAGVVSIAIIINVSVGWWQERKAEKDMDALRALSSPSATVIRDSKTEVIPKYVFAAWIVADAHKTNS